MAELAITAADDISSAAGGVSVTASLLMEATVMVFFLVEASLMVAVEAKPQGLYSASPI